VVEQAVVVDPHLVVFVDRQRLHHVATSAQSVVAVEAPEIDTPSVEEALDGADRVVHPQPLDEVDAEDADDSGDATDDHRSERIDPIARGHDGH
jgi:hypothetical protein